MINIPKGTKDCLPGESYKWHYIEEKIREITSEYGIKEIRTPTFEHTELFVRGVGNTSDIVNKEMYTFLDKKERSITLKPEGTAGVARSYVENGLDNNPQPTKMYYLTSVFRYEQPQEGRLREHHQFGVECYGSQSPYADAEMISLVKTLFDRLGVSDVALHINSIGCPACRAEYAKALQQYYEEKVNELCQNCKERLYKNPLRLLDCKEKSCKDIANGAPVVLDYLCKDCEEHHESLLRMLDGLGIAYQVDPKIVRGLDYYTRTVFEFVSTAIGSQGTVCGGGRYNGLVESIGGKDTPAVGFGMGLERLIMVMERAGLSVGAESVPKIYIAPIGEAERATAMRIVYSLRIRHISAETDLLGRSLKAQMKFADKRGYPYVLVLGENELATDTGELKNMITKEIINVKISELYRYL